MRILFDQGVPLPLKRWLTSQEVETARQRGWSEFLNGDLLAAAEAAGFDLFITTDQNLRHQLDLGQFPIAVLVLMVTNWPTMEPFASEIAAAVDRIGPRQCMEWFPP